MEEELSSFFEGSFLNLNQPEQPFPSIQTPQMHCVADPPVFSPELKALNPDELFKDYPPQLRQPLINSSFKKKLFTGIQILFGIHNHRDEGSEFLGSIDANAFGPSDPYHNILDLFPDEEEMVESPKTELDEQLDKLTEGLSKIQHQTFNTIRINKTIGQTFAQNLDNFLTLKEESGFSQFLLSSLQGFFCEIKKNINSGIHLITLIYDFWMKMFKEFVRQVWKHSQKYTLNVFKRQKVSTMEGASSCGRSTTSSSQANDKDKRRPWGKSQIELLQKIISSNAIFSQARLQQLAYQLNRTTSSISSKVAKLTKLKKEGDQPEKQDKIQESSIQLKIKYILESNPTGLSKDELIEKMGEEFEMGEDESWKNSVSSLLSGSKGIQKQKPFYKLINPLRYYNYTFSQNMKDRLIRVLSTLPDNQGDLNQICQGYSQLYYEMSPEIKSNISKSLGRYGSLFEKNNSKVIYKIQRPPNRFDEVLV